MVISSTKDLFELARHAHQLKSLSLISLKGGAGSGNFHHSGRKGKVGGSANSEYKNFIGKSKYIPDFNAQDKGNFVFVSKSDDPIYIQDHKTLVEDAVHSWKGWPTMMMPHMEDERNGEPVPGSGSGKIYRKQAAALIWEIVNNSKLNNVKLFRGSHQLPSGVQEWSEKKSTAQKWANKNNGKVMEMEKGFARGIKINDYIRDDFERGWLVYVS